MQYPRTLRKGDAIGVTAPSFGVTEPIDVARFTNAKRRLSERGYRVVETPDVYQADETGRSAPAERRAEEFDSLVADLEVPLIVAASGGDYEYEMLEHVDWESFEGNPTWFQGYSDNTALAFSITAEHDIASLYAGNFGDFGMEPWHRSVEEELQFAEGTRSEQDSFPMHVEGFSDRITGLEPIVPEVPTVWESPTGDVSIEGRLIGGCMDVLEWFHKKGGADPRPFVDRYSGEGIVWYMETYDMDDDRIRAMLSGMSRDGWLDGVSGFVFGRELFYTGDGYADVIAEELKQFGVPMVFGADVGHKAPRMTFINGAVARFDVRGGACHLGYRFE